MMQDPVGHRAVTHESDIQLDAWAPTCERCLAEAVEALADHFVTTHRPQASELVEWTHLDHDPESLLGYLLDWVVYHHRVFARIPVATHIEHSNEWNIRVETAALNGTPLLESVYVRDVSVRPERGGWYCHATLDVGKETAELACTPAPESTPRIQRVISEATSRFD